MLVLYIPMTDLAACANKVIQQWPTSGVKRHWWPIYILRKKKKKIPKLVGKIMMKFTYQISFLVCLMVPSLPLFNFAISFFHWIVQSLPLSSYFNAHIILAFWLHPFISNSHVQILILYPYFTCQSWCSTENHKHMTKNVLLL